MKNKLILFHEKVKELRENGDFFVNLSTTINYKEGETMHTQFTGPDKKTFKAFIGDFRIFILNDEPVNFNYISNAIFKSTSDDKIKQNIIKAREAWSKLLERKKGFSFNGVKLVVDEQVLTSEKILDVWFNADRFHLKDSEKRDFFERITKGPIGQISYIVLIDVLQRLSQVLFWFDKNVIEPALLGNTYV